MLKTNRGFLKTCCLTSDILDDVCINAAACVPCAHCTRDRWLACPDPSMHCHGNGTAAIRILCAASSRCAALGREASVKGTVLSRLKECKDDQYPLHPYFHSHSSACRISPRQQPRPINDCVALPS